MSVRGLLAGAVLLAVLGGAVWWSERNAAEKEKNPSTDTPKLITLKEDEVNRIEIARRDEPPTILQKEKAAWQITGPKPGRVDADSVSSVVSSFTGLTWDRLVEEKTEDLGQFGLQQPAVKVSANGKTLLVGDETPTGGGYFAKLEGDARVFSINSGTKSTLDKSWKDLQDKRLLTFDESKLTRVEVAAKGQAIEFGKNAQNEWQIVKPRPVRADNWAVEELVRKLKDAKMDTTVSDEDAAKAGGKFASATRIAVATVTDAAGTQTFEVRKSGDDYYAKSSVLEGVHKVNSDVGQGLDKSFDDFRNKKLFDFGFSDPTKISVRYGDQSWHFVKGGEKWWFNGKEVDSTSVQSLIDKLRDLSATGFPTGATPAFIADINVTSNEGKRNEKVSLSADGVAQRENEPSLYQIDPKTPEEIRKAAADVKPPPPPAQGAAGSNK